MNQVTLQVGSTDATSCAEFCDPGTYFPTGAVDPVTGLCLNCYAGNFSDGLASTSCKQCGPGSYTTDNNRPNNECIPCEKGKFTAVNGSVFCEFCSDGTFSPHEGSTTCLPCQPGTFSGNSTFEVAPSPLPSFHTSCPETRSSCTRQHWHAHSKTSE
jgi:hypothetical protein